MDTRTGEIFTFKDNKALQEAKRKNPYLVSIDCKSDCNFREIRNNRVFCNAVRKERRAIKCFRQFEGTNNQKRIA